MSSSQFTFENDILLSDIDLWLDSRRVREFGFVSHAHSDHIARHKKILCSPPTADLLQTRIKEPNILALPYKQPLKLNDSTISLHPAGHILGSAQIRIEKDGQALLYTGDFRTRPAKTAEPFEFVPADILIMESTFGLPRYKMPPREQIEAELIEICWTMLKNGKTPVVFAYSLGKGQEALKILSEANLPLAVDYAILRHTNTYRKYGVTFGAFEKFKMSEYQNKVVLLPTEFRFRRQIQRLANAFTIFLSGWGIDASAANRFGVDRVLPISDHADYDELISFVEKTRPGEVYCTHGFEQFVSILRNAGFRAYVLEKHRQLELDLQPA